MANVGSQNACYVPLDNGPRTIRLLHLIPALHPEDGRIQCRLVTASLDDGPLYEALSYMWGDPDDLDLQIWIDGVLFPVRLNLWSALRALWSGLREDRVLWIDALCINQLNVSERNHQVGLMGQIYGGAETVLVWLRNVLSTITGDKRRNSSTSTRSTEDFQSTFEFLETAAVETKSIDFKSERVLEDLRKWLDEFVFNMEFKTHWIRLENLLKVHYWERLWVFQEIVLARKIVLVCGNASCDWDVLSTIGKAMDRYPTTMASGIANISYLSSKYRAILSVLQSRARKFDIIRDEIITSARMLPMNWEKIPFVVHRPHGMAIEDLLSACDGSYCHDPRDRIYGILGLLEFTAEDKIVVDYTKTLSELYGNVMRYFFQHDPPKESIVNFSQLLQRAMLSPLSQQAQPLEMELSDSQAFSNETVIVEGIIFGSISMIDSETRDTFKAMERIESPFQNLTRGQSDLKALRLRRLRRLDPRFIARTFRTDHKDHFDEQGSREKIGNAVSMPDKERELVLFSVCEHFEDPYHSTSGLRYIGIAPAAAKMSDLVCRFAKTDINVIIRPYANGYQAIGRAVLSDKPGKQQNLELKWPPPAFEYQLEYHRNDWNQDRIVKLEISLRDLQYLSCPFGQRTYQEMVRDYGNGVYGDISVLGD